MTNAFPTPTFPFSIGCPVWSCDRWGQVVYPNRTARRDWLSWYTRMFNTVEGNSTFYALPTTDIAKRWAAESAEGFQFALKFPRDLSHEGELGPSSLLDRFIEIVDILDQQQHAGPSFLQLPPWYDASRLEELEKFLQLLPSHLPWAVEVRHPSWFGEDDREASLHELLVSLKIDRVIFDSRALFQSPPDDEVEAESQMRKPKSPIRFVRTGTRPVVRIVGRNRVELSDQYIAQWLPILDQWVRDGCRPYVFTHAPDDTFAPAFARRMAGAFHAQFCPQSPQLPSPPSSAKQLTLFDD